MWIFWTREVFQIVNHIGLLRRHEVAQCDNPWPCDNWISHPCLLAKGRFFSPQNFTRKHGCLRINGRRGGWSRENKDMHEIMYHCLIAWICLICSSYMSSNFFKMFINSEVVVCVSWWGSERILVNPTCIPPLVVTLMLLGFWCKISCTTWDPNETLWETSGYHYHKLPISTGWPAFLPSTM